jgi:hypothetical protein
LKLAGQRFVRVFAQFLTAVFRPSVADIGVVSAGYDYKLSGCGDRSGLDDEKVTGLRLGRATDSVDELMVFENFGRDEDSLARLEERFALVDFPVYPHFSHSGSDRNSE